ncbi:hypothetical protein, partial [Escherichia coli]|uniref:hypothetical protein n=1 Tax=Escherichia coli TaxID=562 RepID=UPI001FA94398
KQKKLIMLPSETMIWQPEFTDKTLSRKPGAVQIKVYQMILCMLFSVTAPQESYFLHRRNSVLNYYRAILIWLLSV